jgi:DNA mismatch repair protein MutS
LGYFYEINSNQLSLVPTDYLLLQSLVGRSRFTNDSLKELAYKIANAELQSQQLEAELFDKICIVVREALSPLRRTAHTLAQIDMLFSFAKLAYDNNYCRPTFVGGDVLEIEQGRHPVVEFCSAISFVPNDTKFDQAHRLMILTGPNMGGKSTYLRQVAHIVILAHAGAFVPAKSCRLSIIDRVFTRIGSGDNLAAGKSTFLVEMEEVALICSAANKSSLIILDEVGRGTSTFDGMAIAQAILEYLFDSVAAKTLFATHYHELTVLAKCRSGVNNYHMGCQEVGDNLVFSHRLLQGAAGASFGIAVAKLAGLPVPILARAKELLHEFKGRAVFASDTGMKDNVVVQSELENKLLIYEKVFAEITALPLDDMTPRTAHQFLQKLQQKISETKISD